MGETAPAGAKWAALSVGLWLWQVPAQEITLRVETREVAVPFVVFNERGMVQACPAAGELVVRENGSVRPIRGVQELSDEPIALGIVLELGGGSGLVQKEDTREAFLLARDLLRDSDGCVAVNATATFDSPKTRQSPVQQGRAGCLPMLADAAERMAQWVGSGDVLGWSPYAWAGVRRAIEDLGPDPRLRKAIVLFGRGQDDDHFHVPGSLKRLARDNLTGVFALYLKPNDFSDPEMIAHMQKYGPRGPVERDPIFVTWFKRGLENLQDLTAHTGGKLYQVNKLTVRGAAREVVAGLRRQCLLTYSPLEDGSSSNWRKIEVTAAKKGWKVRHRPGYIPEQAMAVAVPE